MTLNRSVTNRRRNHRRGTVMFIALIMIVVSLAAAAFCIDVAYMQLVQTQLRTATDAATRAGALGLAQGSVDDARQRAKDIALLNNVAGAPLVLDDSDIVFGTATQPPGDPAPPYTFTPSSSAINAVQVAGRKTTGSPSGDVTLFLGPKLWGSGPFQPTKGAAASIADRDIVLVLDRSGSMDTEDSGVLPGSLAGLYSGEVFDHDGDGRLKRIEALKVAVGEFLGVLNELPSAEQVGMVSYATNSTPESDLDTSYSSFESSVHDLEASGWTNIGEGIDDAVEMLQNTSLARPTADPVIIVMTDGIHNQTRDPEDAARDAMAALSGLTIHTVTFSDGAEQWRMQSVANIGNGIHIHAQDVSQLVDTFEEMARTAGVILIQ